MNKTLETQLSLEFCKTQEHKKFFPINVSSKFAICGLPIRLDTYKTCSFQCAYCFSNCRKIMEFEKNLQVADVKRTERYLQKLFNGGAIPNRLLDTLITSGITWHCGGMSDPFQPCEKEYHATKDIIDLTNKHNISVLFSTKSDNVYDVNLTPELHAFQFSVTNIQNNRDIEPNVPDIQKRYELFRQLKAEGFKVGIRIQPFIPNVSTIEIVKLFSNADHFTLEGLKLVPQNAEHKQKMLSITGLKSSDFTQMGLLNLKPEIRQKLYKPFIEYFEDNNISYSIADNDMHNLGNNYCCCGDKLIKCSTTINNTHMYHFYGEYCKEQLDEELFNSGLRDCICNTLFTSNRQEGCKTIGQFYDKRFYRKSSPFSPLFTYNPIK